MRMWGVLCGEGVYMACVLVGQDKKRHGTRVNEV
jgi:hypothetical protein